jgi:putative restriction endonuclease
MAQEIRTERFEITARTPPPGKITYEAFLAWADEDTRAEWVDGEVVILSPSSDKHQNLAGFLSALLRYFVEAHQSGLVLFAPFQMKTGPDLPGREPDILFIAHEHLDRLKNVYLDGPADLVVEIISPDSRGRDRGEKFYEYEQGGCASTGCSTRCAVRPNFISVERTAFFTPCSSARMASIAVPCWKACGSRLTGSGKSRYRRC